MARLASVLVVGAFLTSACTMVRINSDDTSTIEHQGGIEVGRDLANRACRKAGQQSADVEGALSTKAMNEKARIAPLSLPSPPRG